MSIFDDFILPIWLYDAKYWYVIYSSIYIFYSISHEFSFWILCIAILVYLYGLVKKFGKNDMHWKNKCKYMITWMLVFRIIRISLLGDVCWNVQWMSCAQFFLRFWRWYVDTQAQFMVSTFWICCHPISGNW